MPVSVSQRNRVTRPESRGELGEAFRFVGPACFSPPRSPLCWVPSFLSRPPCPLPLLSLVTRLYFPPLPFWTSLPHVWGSISSSLLSFSPRLAAFLPPLAALSILLLPF